MFKDGLYIVLISVHGLIRGNDLELGRDADTGGQTKYVLELAAALGKHKDVKRVELFTRAVYDGKVDEEYAKPYEQIGENAYIVRFPCGPQRYLKKESMWPHLDVFTDNAIKHFRKIGNVPDVIHAHYADAGYVGADLSNLLGVPLIFTGHSLGREKKRLLSQKGLSPVTIENKYNISKRIEAEEVALDNALLVIASTNQEIEKQYSSYENYRTKQMQVIPPGVDLTRFYPGKKRGIYPKAFHHLKKFLYEPTKPCIMAISRADERKNIMSLLNAYGKSEKLQELANLVLVAGNRDDISKMDKGTKRVLTDIIMGIDKYDLYGKACYPKRHAPDEVPEFYKIAGRLKGVFINPALTEPFGLTLIEAAASGVPIVATNDGGPRDIISNCKNGVLIDPLDEKDITEALINVLEDQKQWQAYSANGLKGVKRHYSWGSHVNKYISAIKKRLKLKRGNELVPDAKTVIPKVKKLLISDIDNTLLGHKESAERIAEFLIENKSVMGFCVATGRRVESAKNVLKEWNMPEPDVVISSVGTEIYYKGKKLRMDEGWAKHISHLWEPEKIREIFDGLDGLVLQPKKEQRDYKVSYYYDPKIAPKAGEMRRLLRHENVHAKVVLSHGQFLDILPIRASKGKAVRYLAMKWGIEPEDVLVAGDSGNDEDMLNGNTLGVVVGNYSKELRKLRGKHAVYFAENEFADGIIEGIEHYNFLKSL